MTSSKARTNAEGKIASRSESLAPMRGAGVGAGPSFRRTPFRMQVGLSSEKNPDVERQ